MSDFLGDLNNDLSELYARVEAIEARQPARPPATRWPPISAIALTWAALIFGASLLVAALWGGMAQAYATGPLVVLGILGFNVSTSALEDHRR